MNYFVYSTEYIINQIILFCSKWRENSLIYFMFLSFGPFDMQFYMLTRRQGFCSECRVTQVLLYSFLHYTFVV